MPAPSMSAMARPKSISPRLSCNTLRQKEREAKLGAGAEDTGHEGAVYVGRRVGGVGQTRRVNTVTSGSKLEGQARGPPLLALPH